MSGDTSVLLCDEGLAVQQVILCLYLITLVVRDAGNVPYFIITNLRTVMDPTFLVDMRLRYKPVCCIVLPQDFTAFWQSDPGTVSCLVILITR